MSFGLPEFSAASTLVNIMDYGAVGDGQIGGLGTDDTDAILRAVAYCKAIGGTLIGPPKVFRFTSTILIDSPMSIIGSYNGVHNGGNTDGFVFLKDGNFPGIEVTASAGPALGEFCIMGDTGNGGQGIKLTQCGRASLFRLTSIGHGGDGLEYVNGNLTSGRDLYLLNNGGRGLWFNGAATPDTNASDWRTIDARGNASYGVDIDNAWNITGYFICQQNGHGININNCRGGHFDVYSEANSGNDVIFTNHTNLEGNIINLLFYGDVVDGQVKPEQNHITRSLAGADTRTAFDYVNAHHFRLPTEIGISGSMSLEHPSTAKYLQAFEETGQAQTLEIKNTGSLADRIADDPVYPVYHQIHGAFLSERANLPDDDVTPDVSLSQFWLANNSSLITITNFDGGTPGMVIRVLANNTKTTIEHSAGGPGITLKGGVDKTLAQYECLTFIKNGGTWWIEI